MENPVNAMDNAVNALALRAADDRQAREELIREHEALILRTASVACRRFVTRSDDEWSIALWAFSRAVDDYSPTRGDFLPFAATLIRRDLIDYYRHTRRYQQEVSVSPYAFTGDAEEDTLGVAAAVARDSRQNDPTELRREIADVSRELEKYGFRFFDLTDCSPRQEKTRQSCARAVRAILESPLLLAQLRHSRTLPVKAVSAQSGVDKKTLDRYRKYILMAVTVLAGDYPGLASHLKFVTREAEQ